VIFLWLKRQQFPVAGFAASLLLTCSPTLISLSAQVRGYMLELLFAALSLYFLDAALETASSRQLLYFTGFFYCAVTTEYQFAFAAAAMGIYALIRMWNTRYSFQFISIWLAGQIGALGIYGLLYSASIERLMTSPSKAMLVEGYLSVAFPQPGESLLQFSVASIMKPFTFFLGSVPLGVTGFLLFTAGIYYLSHLRNMRALVVSLVAVFVLMLAGALLHVHPYGGTRHAAILALFAATGIGFAFEWIALQAYRLVLPTLLLIAAGALAVDRTEPYQAPISERERVAMTDAVERMNLLIPADAVILADRESSMLLNYYGGPRRYALTAEDKGQVQSSRGSKFVLHSYRYSYWSLSELDEDTRLLRSHLNLSETHPIWVVDGGFSILYTPFPNHRIGGNCFSVYKIP
jgi:hypothetical protein